MAKEYIEKETLIKYLRDKQVALENIDCINMAKDIGRIIRHIEQDKIPTADVVEVVRCKDCIHAVEVDKHCEISRTLYKHCSLLRGDETNNVWHKYKKYYKDYSIVEAEEFCSYGERKENANL